MNNKEKKYFLVYNIINYIICTSTTKKPISQRSCATNSNRTDTPKNINQQITTKEIDYLRTIRW